MSATLVIPPPPNSSLPVGLNSSGPSSGVAGTASNPSAAANPWAPQPPAVDGKIAGKVLIIDDEPINVKVARKYLRTWGYQDVQFTTEPADAIDLALRERPDLILLDVMMPGISGLELLAEFRRNPETMYIPVIILTAHSDAELKLRALEAGANDFLSKPIDPNELLPRVRNLLLMKGFQNRLRDYSHELEHEVRRRTLAVEASRRHVINCLARAAEFRDNETGRHVIRVGMYAGLAARGLSMSPEYCEMIEQAAKLHDVGKIGVPDNILLKPGKLEPEEYEVIQRHCGYGRRVFEKMPEEQWETLQHHVHVGAAILEADGSPLLEMASRIALTHHERWDGTGYPLGLAGEEIPLEGRITAVADVFDALSSKRPYKPAFPLDKCFQILREGCGNHFEPRIVDAFLEQRAEIIQIQLEHSDSE